MSDIFGHTSQMPFAFYDPDASCLRTCEATLLSDSTEFSVTLPVSGSMLSWQLFQRPKLVPATGENASSLLPLIGTPVATARPRSKATRDSGRNPTPAELVALLPTPTCSDARDGKHVRQMTVDAMSRGASKGVNLNHLWENQQVREFLLPTPTRRDHKGRNQRNDDTCLPGALLPTPRAQDGPHGGPGQTNSRGEPDSLPAIGALLPTPQATNNENRQSDNYGPNLGEALLPTPVADNSGGIPSPTTDYQSLANTAQQLTDGPVSSDENHPNPPPAGDSTPSLWNG